MEATAFSFSNSMIGWAFEILSPSLTKTFTTVPESAPSPRFGNFRSIPGSHDLRENLFRFDLQLFNRFLNLTAIQLPLLRQRIQRGDDHTFCVTFEETPEALAGV